MILLDRRNFLAGSAAAAGLAGAYPGWAMGVSPGLAAAKGSSTLSGNDIAIKVGNSAFNVDGRIAHAVSMNGTIPGPLVRLREGQNVRITVKN